MFCLNCGRQIPDGSKFCQSCGANQTGQSDIFNNLGTPYQNNNVQSSNSDIKYNTNPLVRNSNDNFNIENKNGQTENFTKSPDTNINSNSNPDIFFYCVIIFTCLKSFAFASDRYGLYFIFDIFYYIFIVLDLKKIKSVYGKEEMGGVWQLSLFVPLIYVFIRNKKTDDNFKLAFFTLAALVLGGFLLGVGKGYTEQKNLNSSKIATENTSSSKDIGTMSTKNIQKTINRDSSIQEIKKLKKDGYIYCNVDGLSNYKDFFKGKKIFTIAKLTDNSDYEGSTDDYTVFEWSESMSKKLEPSDDFDKNEKIQKGYINKSIIISGELNESNVINCNIVSDNKKDIEFIKKEYKPFNFEGELLSKFSKDAKKFKNKCSSVSFNDLKNNPDLYKGKKIKVTVKVTRVDPDGLIMQGTQLGTIDGNKVAISDDREVRSPRFTDNSEYVFYGYGDDTRTIKKSGVGGKLSDIWSGNPGYSVPCVRVLYTDNDNYKDWVSIIKEGNDDYHVSR